MSDYSSPVARRRKLPSLAYELPPQSEIAAARLARSKLGPVLGLLLYGMAALLAIDNDTFRRIEVHMVAPVAAFAVGSNKTLFVGTAVYFDPGTFRTFGLNLTAECTSALLLIPLLVMMGSFMIFTSLSLRRQVVAVLTGSALILAVNMIRVAGIAWATRHYGVAGYDYSHVFVGSAFSLVGFVGAILVALWILVRSGRFTMPAAHPVRALRGRHRAN